MKLQLIPFKKVGPFEFDMNIEFYQEFDFIYNKCDDSTNWDLHENLEIGLRIYTEDKKIVSIECYRALIYNNSNLIGCTIKELESLIGEKLPIEKDKIYLPENDDYQDVYELDKLGIQIWIYKGIIETIFCSPLIED